MYGFVHILFALISIYQWKHSSWPSMFSILDTLRCTSLSPSLCLSRSLLLLQPNIRSLMCTHIFIIHVIYECHISHKYLPNRMSFNQSDSRVDVTKSFLPDKPTHKTPCDRKRIFFSFKLKKRMVDAPIFFPKMSQKETNDFMRIIFILIRLDIKLSGRQMSASTNKKNVWCHHFCAFSNEKKTVEWIIPIWRLQIKLYQIDCWRNENRSRFNSHNLLNPCHFIEWLNNFSWIC